MSTVVQGPDLMLPEEVAGAFRVRTAQVTRWAKAGKLACIQTPGRHRRYFRAEVQAFLNGTPLSAEQVAKLRDQIGGAR